MRAMALLEALQHLLGWKLTASEDVIYCSVQDTSTSNTKLEGDGDRNVKLVQNESNASTGNESNEKTSSF